MADVVIIAGEKPSQEKIFAHRQILAASSEVFQKMLFGPFLETQKREIEIPNIQPRIMRSLLEFMYRGTAVLDTEVLVPLI
mmetsp:Transcript_13658/g.9828  ORF Transcript_13658/g.9828 Transcript_13658/m.9828 type:complete len:81 (+) Transcript_13658:176-418(+)